MTTEQTRVDVLRRDAQHAEAYRLAYGYVGGTLADARKESDEAIAAVTELLAAAEEAEQDAAMGGGNYPRLRAALAAFAPQRAEQEAS